MKDLSIVIPLGVGGSGTPVLKYLKWCVESINSQKTNYNYDLIFSCDTNIPDEVKNYLNYTNCLIEWYEPHFYFKKGGIWKKIYDQWIKFESKYLAFSHYDDIWSENKIESQLKLLESTNSDICWSRVQTINKDNNILGEMRTLDTLNKNTLFGSPSYAFSHSSIVSRNILKTGIVEHQDNWSAIYEELFFVYAHKLKGIKDHQSIFYHRVHSDSISNTFNNEQSESVVSQRNATGYSLIETLEDAKIINIDQIRDNINQNILT